MTIYSYIYRRETGARIYHGEGRHALKQKPKTKPQNKKQKINKKKKEKRKRKKKKKEIKKTWKIL